MTGQPLALPPALSPDSLDALSELSLVVAKVRAGIQSSASDPPPTAAGGQISFKDLPGATDALKHKIQSARSQVKALPDMDRTIEQQAAEIGRLEEKIKLQKDLLERLREDGAKLGKDVDKMET
ncbi:hypothetical protein VHEMI06106 [[Torrubiella] hemipterigena]|uniref:Mediator of RNA polymerase II transcription subunit 9 n=1 Tax=[Torrubiella] hemipterigena TaxID=1531966 RepID=A0A0A1TIA2_9HYPO|nr:hypothetical protein VHEMI06106 [[Torrubiella] hemipterigena]